ISHGNDPTALDEELAIGRGRGLQAVNILRKQDEAYQDRGVRVVPDGCTRGHVSAYAREHLHAVDHYIASLDTRTVVLVCTIPVALAKRTLKAMEEGQEEVSRCEVEESVENVKKDS